MPALVAIAISASLLHFNRHAEWDDWALYFFGSYGLGIMAWWAGDPARRPATVWLLLAASVLIALAALAIDFRSRIALALVTAGVLIWLGRARLFHAGPGALLVHRLGQISYSQFLVHFPVSLVVNAVFIRFMPAQPLPQAAGMLLAWAGSLAAGFAFHYWVERPLDRVVMRYLDFLSQPRSRDIDAAGRADAGMAI
jgi:peptidoglycan/LPS O-acetylase OafA/YrhL